MVADADLSPERRLAGSKNQSVATYRELMGNIATRTNPNGGAIALMLIAPPIPKKRSRIFVWSLPATAFWKPALGEVIERDNLRNRGYLKITHCCVEKLL